MAQAHLALLHQGDEAGDVAVHVSLRVVHSVPHAGLCGQVKDMREVHETEHLGEERLIVDVAIDNETAMTRRTTDDEAFFQQYFILFLAEMKLPRRWVRIQLCLHLHALPEQDLLPGPFQSDWVVVVEVVNSDNTIPTFAQCQGRVEPHKSCSTCYQNDHPAISRSGRSSDSFLPRRPLPFSHVVADVSCLETRCSADYGDASADNEVVRKSAMRR